MRNISEIFHHSITLPIYYEDTDFSGFVYHANYLKFFERGREHLIGIENLRRLYQEGTHFAVHRLEADYKRPARHGDQITIETHIADFTGVRLMFRHTARLGTPEAPGETLVEAVVYVAVLGRNNRPKRLSPDAWDLIHRPQESR